MNGLTPMMQQYFKIKDEYKDCIVMFRLGDFYEMFFDDATLASKELELTLTGRDCGLEQRAPMCGVPFHAVDTYINRLLSKNYKVAVCDQLEDPAAAKGMVKRGVTRVITPGTVTDANMLSDRENNYIMSLFWAEEKLGISYCDVSTGAFFVYECEKDTQTLINNISRVAPRELIVPDGARDAFLKTIEKTSLKNLYVTPYFDFAFDLETARHALLDHFKVANLSGFGCEKLSAAICSGGALVTYLKETQKNDLLHINSIKTIDSRETMALDVTTVRNLELTQTIIDGKKRGSLLWLLDKTKTSIGARLLKRFIENPLKNIDDINMRLDAVEEIKTRQELCETLCDTLKNVFDLERLISKISYGSLNARDCVALKCSLRDLPEIKSALSGAEASLLRFIHSETDELADVYSLLSAAIADEPPLSVREGGIIKRGYDREIDEMADASENSKNWLAQLEAKEREETGIPKLKIGYNKVFGYYIEVTNSYKDKAPYRYTRKQTLANCERYITAELKEMEDTILNAEERRCSLEYSAFLEVREKLALAVGRIQKTANAIAYADVLNSLALSAKENGYIRPVMSNDGRIAIKDGRHPVVEKMMKQSFVPNDVAMDRGDNNLLIITGPNMAGKSTYMRMTGLIVLMAHIGSFVPAAKARICVTDRIFTRVGASDDLSAGQSTFMVEMNELANILNNATKKSLLILDEIGRGTSTIDGLSIAWAVIEYILDNIGAKTLFATHYHELIELESIKKGIKNYSIAVREFGNEIIFLHKIINKGTDKSFGVEVARLAGLPAELTARARQLLARFQDKEFSILEAQKPEEEQPQRTDAQRIIKLLEKTNVDSLTPLEALNLINTLKEEL